MLKITNSIEIDGNHISCETTTGKKPKKFELRVVKSTKNVQGKRTVKKRILSYFTNSKFIYKINN